SPSRTADSQTLTRCSRSRLYCLSHADQSPSRESSVGADSTFHWSHWTWPAVRRTSSRRAMYGLMSRSSPYLRASASSIALSVAVLAMAPLYRLPGQGGNAVRHLQEGLVL